MYNTCSLDFHCKCVTVHIFLFGLFFYKIKNKMSKLFSKIIPQRQSIGLKTYLTWILLKKNIVNPLQLNILFSTCRYNSPFVLVLPGRSSDRAVACPHCQLCDPSNSNAHEGFIQVRRVWCIKVKWAASCFVFSWVAVGRPQHRETPTKQHLKRLRGVGRVVCWRSG